MIIYLCEHIELQKKHKSTLTLTNSVGQLAFHRVAKRHASTQFIRSHSTTIICPQKSSNTFLVKRKTNKIYLNKNYISEFQSVDIFNSKLCMNDNSRSSDVPSISNILLPMSFSLFSTSTLT